MTSTGTAEPLRAEFDRLDAERERLSTALLLSAQRLESDGVPADDELLADLTAYSRALRSVAQRLVGDAAVPSFSGTADRRMAWEDVARTLEARHQTRRALAVLDDVLALRYADSGEFGPLSDCQRAARQLQETLSDLHAAWPEADVVQLVSGWHPLAVVAQLATADATLPDDEWLQLQEIVATTYGRPLATALVRGRVRRAEVATTANSVVLPQASSSQSAVSVPLLAPLDAEGDGGRDDSVLSFPSSEQRVPLAISSADTAHRLAQQAAASSGIRRFEHLAELTWQLILDDRIPLAAQFAECRETRGRKTSATVSGALLRALSLGRELRYGRGELARTLDGELRTQRPATLISTADDEAVAIGYLARAACLLPALFGASPAANALLRAFPIEPGLTHFYNYCTRVAVFGERLQGQAADLFQDTSGDHDWHNEYGRLQREVSGWMADSVRRAATYVRTSPLYLHAHWTLLSRAAQRQPSLIHEWAKWQETLLAAHRLLRPVRDGRDQERQQVKLEVHRIASQLRVEPLEEMLSKPPGSRGIVVPREQMQALLLEAVDLSNRWLRLCTTMPSRSPALPPQSVDDLRTELLERTPAVLSELKAIERAKGTTPIRAVLSQCCRSIESIRNLCSGQVRVGLHEPDPRQVLHADLLKIADLELNDQWQPAIDRCDVERLLLEQLPAMTDDWQTAFDRQCRAGDHLATARLLELPAWDDEQRAVLTRRRNAELHACRTTATAAIDEARRKMQHDAESRPELAEARTEFDQRLESLLLSMPRLDNFARFHRQLQQQQTVWQRVLLGESVTWNGLTGSAATAVPESPVAGIAPASAWVFNGE